MAKFLYLLLFLVSVFHANSTALLVSFVPNHYLRFFYEYFFFTCHPYGIVTLSEKYLDKDLDDKCKDRFDIFRKKFPKERVYAHYILNLEQKYHIDAVDNECLIYMNGGETYSEVLLRNGYAYIKNGIVMKDLSIKDRFEYAQNIAKENKSGLFYDEDFAECLIK